MDLVFRTLIVRFHPAYGSPKKDYPVWERALIQKFKRRFFKN